MSRSRRVYALTSELTLSVGTPRISGGRAATVEATELTLRGRTWVLERALGTGATSVVWLARDGQRQVALKLGRGKAQRPRFSEESARLAWVGSDALVGVIDAGLVREGLRLPDGSSIEAGSPFLVLDYVAGVALEPADARSPEAARALALV